MLTSIKDQGSRIWWSLENALDMKKKPLQRLPRAIEKWHPSIKGSAKENQQKKMKSNGEYMLATLLLGTYQS